MKYLIIVTLYLILGCADSSDNLAEEITEELDTLFVKDFDTESDSDGIKLKSFSHDVLVTEAEDEINCFQQKVAKELCHNNNILRLSDRFYDNKECNFVYDEETCDGSCILEDGIASCDTTPYHICDNFDCSQYEPEIKLEDEFNSYVSVSEFTYDEAMQAFFTVENEEEVSYEPNTVKTFECRPMFNGSRLYPGEQSKDDPSTWTEESWAPFCHSAYIVCEEKVIMVGDVPMCSENYKEI